MHLWPQRDTYSNHLPVLELYLVANSARNSNNQTPGFTRLKVPTSCPPHRQADSVSNRMSNPVSLQPTTCAPQAASQSQIGSATMSAQYTPPDAVTGSHNPLSALGKQSHSYTTRSNKEPAIPARASHRAVTCVIKIGGGSFLTARAADAADLCLRTGLDPDLLQVAMRRQGYRNKLAEVQARYPNREFRSPSRSPSGR